MNFICLCMFVGSYLLTDRYTDSNLTGTVFNIHHLITPSLRNIPNAHANYNSATADVRDCGQLPGTCNAAVAWKTRFVSLYTNLENALITTLVVQHILHQSRKNRRPISCMLPDHLFVPRFLEPWPIILLIS